MAERADSVDGVEGVEAAGADQAEGVDRDVKADLDERRIAKYVAYGLPFVTFWTAVAFALFIGPAMAILVLAAGVLLGVISLFWASLRVLSGDAPLPEELALLDVGAHGVDQLATRKLMLVRSLKDLEAERALGKLDDDDFEQLSQNYRNELKDVLRRIDASLEPHREKAERAAREYLARSGLASAGASDAAPVVRTQPADAPTRPMSREETAQMVNEAARLGCPKCATSNEPDAAFCKKCGTSLAAVAGGAPTKESTHEA
ncbi:MAG: hypothetical protein JWP97_3309 [Labilithrix sp.]|nr:hypothetical protein [Labilithrix sp.]